MPVPAELNGEIAVIGGGAAGCELAISLQRHYSRAGTPARCHLFSRSARLLPTAPKAASAHMQNALTQNQITLHQNIAVREVTKNSVITELYPSQKNLTHLKKDRIIIDSKHFTKKRSTATFTLK